MTRYLRIRGWKRESFWMIADDPPEPLKKTNRILEDLFNSFLKSGRATNSPLSPAAGPNSRHNVKRWRYSGDDGHTWKQSPSTCKHKDVSFSKISDLSKLLQRGLLSAQLEGPLSLKAIILGSMWRLEIIREELFIDKETPRERIM